MTNDVLKLLEDITIQLNELYYEYSNIKEIYDRIRFISTVKYYKTFIYECLYVRYIINLEDNYDINKLNKLSDNLHKLLELIKDYPKFEPIVHFDSLEDYILYLTVDHLNLYKDILNLQIEQKDDYDIDYYNRYHNDIRKAIKNNIRQYKIENKTFMYEYFTDYIYDLENTSWPNNEYDEESRNNFSDTFNIIYNRYLKNKKGKKEEKKSWTDINEEEENLDYLNTLDIEQLIDMILSSNDPILIREYDYYLERPGVPERRTLIKILQDSYVRTH